MIMANNRLILVNDSNKTFVTISKSYIDFWQPVTDFDRLNRFLESSKADGMFGATASDNIRVIEEIDLPEGYENVL